MKIAEILLPSHKLFPLDYLIPQGLEVNIGDLVVVPFRKKELTGIVWKFKEASDVGKLKEIKAKTLPESSLSRETIELIGFAANYYLSELGSAAKLTLPVDIAEKPIKIKEQIIPDEFNLPELSASQQEALKLLKQSAKPIVVKGVTGSGKTEVYFHLIREYLQQDGQVLIMLPEIALSNQIIKRFAERFGFEPVVWNSLVTKAQKKAILRGILANKIKLVIGARSSLFLPYKNLRLIIVDEEHDGSYKQEDGILYHARDMAILRGSLSDCKVLLCSATPSIETIHNAGIGKYTLVELKSRYREAAMPEILIADMRKENLPSGHWLSSVLIDAVKTTLENREQVLLFLNRRGYAPLVLCRLCGYRFTCRDCSAWLVLHKSKGRLECHHCGWQHKVHNSCPDCGDEDSLTICGPGVERIAEEVETLFPEHKIAVISKDRTSSPEKTQELLHKMENREIDILIGTQIITKGYHFPNLTLVGVVDADLGFIATDLRTSERTFQLLHQVGGRAGRAQKKGRVMLQTYYPDNIVLNCLKNGKEDEFLRHELESRSASSMPPFGKIASIILAGKNEPKVAGFARHIVAAAPQAEISILGPTKAIMSKLAGKYRYRILIVTDRKFNLQKYLNFWLNSIKIPSYLHVKVDIDPQSFF